MTPFEWVQQALWQAKPVEENSGCGRLVVDFLPPDLKSDILSLGLASACSGGYQIGRWRMSILRFPFDVAKDYQEPLLFARYSERQRRLLSFLRPRMARLGGKTAYPDDQWLKLLQELQPFDPSDVERAIDEFLAIDDSRVYAPEKFLLAIVGRQVERSRALVIDGANPGRENTVEKAPEMHELEARSGRIQSRISTWVAEHPASTPQEQIEAIREIERACE